MKKLDGLDSEAIRDMQRSRGWALFLERVGILRNRQMDALIGQLPGNPRGVDDNIRGYIRGLDDMRTIPDTIVAEIKAKGGKHGKVDRAT